MKTNSALSLFILFFVQLFLVNASVNAQVQLDPAKTDKPAPSKKEKMQGKISNSGNSLNNLYTAYWLMNCDNKWQIVQEVAIGNNVVQLTQANTLGKVNIEEFRKAINYNPNKVCKSGSRQKMEYFFVQLKKKSPDSNNPSVSAPSNCFGDNYMQWFSSMCFGKNATPTTNCSNSEFCSCRGEKSGLCYYCPDLYLICNAAIED